MLSITYSCVSHIAYTEKVAERESSRPGCVGNVLVLQDCGSAWCQSTVHEGRLQRAAKKKLLINVTLRHDMTRHSDSTSRRFYISTREVSTLSVLVLV
ncbi:hypothetical protein E2C01_012300 [Portunus trituberculatus]|uniref:Uncharacterized protein n=1 Tax=Portunus trituberculatus TaxID=210409 RepID=A0A5B7DDU1_PORTR|nr:hypothetical protein [Portunus trituberculatus]